MRAILCASLTLLCAAPSSAQVTRYLGASPNLTTAIDFDNPFVPTGPIASNSSVFTSAGISSVALIGTWTAGTDLLTAASNVNGQCLISQGGALAVATAPDPLDDAAAGAGFEITLASAVDEFQLTFVDQVNHTYAIELFSGAASLGIGTFVYAGTFPAPPNYWRGPSPFDRIRVTFPAGVVGIGIDTLAFGNGPAPPPPPPVPANCVETSTTVNGVFNGGNNGNVGGAVFFDLTVTQPVSISGLTTHFNAAIGTSVGLSLYTVPTTSIGNEQTMAAWTLAAMDDGTAISQGYFGRTDVNFVSPLNLSPGSYGICLVAVGSAHVYTNGTATNLAASSANGVLSLSLGGAQNVPFTGAPFTPRIWNGRLCASTSGVGTSYCGPAVANTSGSPGLLEGSGSNTVASNNLTLVASNVPANQFGFFLTSQTQGFVMNPGGSQGNLCLTGVIGRYVAAGQIKNAGAGGTFSLTPDLNLTPAGGVFVAVMPGQTWNFQAWFRDIGPGGVPWSNFTNGLTVSFN